ncbi:MAG: hypothetical protein H6685_06555 [Deltaproteobacteria bacterium]|nr:hypothetical protein [Deltaproteobacteria bacterium]
MSSPPAPKHSHGFKNNIIYLGFLGIAALGRTIPLSVGRRLGALIGRAAWHLVRAERRKTLHHLKIAFPESNIAWRKQVGRETFANLGLGFFEYLHFGELLSGQGRFKDIFQVEGREHLEAAQAKGRGAIFVTGHISAFELLAAYTNKMGYEVHPVVRMLYDERIDKVLNEHRRTHGYGPIATRGQDADALGQIMQVLQNNGFVGIMPDQDTQVRGDFVPFLGQPAHTPTGTAFLAYAAGVDVITAFIHREGWDRFSVRYDAPLEKPNTGDQKQDVLALTQMINDRISDQIRRYPADWVWMHRRWKTRPADEPPHLNPDPKPLPSAPIKAALLTLGEKIAARASAKVLEFIAVWGGFARLKSEAALSERRVQGAELALGPGHSAVVERAAIHGAWNGVDLLRSPRLSDAIFDDVEVLGAQYLDEAYAKKTGAVLVGMDFGAWPLGLWTLSRRGYPIAFWEAPIKNRFNRLWMRRRFEQHGLRAVDPYAKFAAFEEMAGHGYGVYLPLERVGEKDEFITVAFGTGELKVGLKAAKLAATDDRPLLLVYTQRLEDGRARVVILPAPSNATDPADRMRQVFQAWQKILAEHPDQWLAWEQVRPRSEEPNPADAKA